MDGTRQIYHVYGRTTYEQPLTFIRTMPVEKDEAVKDEAVKTVALPGSDQEQWIELIAFPESAIVRAITPEN